MRDFLSYTRMTKKLETSFILLLCILFPFFFFVFARSDTYVKSEIEISFELLKRSHFTGIQNNLLVFSIYAIPLFAIQTQFELRFVEDEAKQVAAPQQTRHPQLKRSGKLRYLTTAALMAFAKAHCGSGKRHPRLRRRRHTPSSDRNARVIGLTP